MTGLHRGATKGMLTPSRPWPPGHKAVPSDSGQSRISRARRRKVDKTASDVVLLYEEPFSADGGGFLNPLSAEVVSGGLLVSLPGPADLHTEPLRRA